MSEVVLLGKKLMYAFKHAEVTGKPVRTIEFAPIFSQVGLIQGPGAVVPVTTGVALSAGRLDALAFSGSPLAVSALGGHLSETCDRWLN